MQREQWFAAQGEKGVVGRFSYEKILDKPASVAADEPVYKDIPVCWAKAAGSADVSCVKVKPHNRHQLTKRFPDAWAHFQGEMVKVNGTPLSDPFHGLTMPEQRAMEFQIHGVNAWEQIADLSDGACGSIGFGVRKLRDQVMGALGMQIPGKPPQQQASGYYQAQQAPAGDAGNGDASPSSHLQPPDTGAPRRPVGRPRKDAEAVA